MGNEIIVNRVIHWISEDDQQENNFERILWISNDKEFLYIIALKQNGFPFLRHYSDVEAALKQHSARILNYTTEEELMVGEFLDEQRKMERDNKWEAIKNIVIDEPDIYIPRYRGILVKEVMKKYELSRPTVDNYLKDYWKAGKNINGLINRYDKCGNKGQKKFATASTEKRGAPRKITKLEPEKIGINTTEEIHKIFMLAKEKFHEEERLSLSASYNKMIRTFFVKEYIEVNGEEVPVTPDRSELPLEDTFYYHVRKELQRNPFETLENKFGERFFNLNLRPKTGNATKLAFGPGARFQIDATIADVNLRSSYRRSLIIGKPVVYTVLDVYSQKFVGLYIGFEGPSYIGAIMAILNMGMPKVPYCAKYGIHITEEQWPCHHFPSQFTADRGELLSKNNRNMNNSLNIDIEYAAPFRADWKPLVESYFNVLNKDVIHRCPGADSLKLKVRGEKDKSLNSVLTLPEFTAIMINKIILHNTSKYLENYQLDEDMVRMGVKPIPIELLNYGIKKHGSLRYFEEDVLKRNLLPRDKTAVITDRGIIFQGVPYTCERAEKKGWFLKSKRKFYQKKVVPVAYDPRFTSKIYIILDNGKVFEECSLIDEEHLANNEDENRAWDDYLHITEVLDIEREVYKDRELQEQIIHDYKFEKQVELSKLLAEQSDVGLSDRQRLMNRRDNRLQEKERNREHEHFFAKEDEIYQSIEVGDEEEIVAREVSVLIENLQNEEKNIPNSNDEKSKPSISPRLLALQKAQGNRK